MITLIFLIMFTMLFRAVLTEKVTSFQPLETIESRVIAEQQEMEVFLSRLSKSNKKIKLSKASLSYGIFEESINFSNSSTLNLILDLYIVSGVTSQSSSKLISSACSLSKIVEFCFNLPAKPGAATYP